MLHTPTQGRTTKRRRKKKFSSSLTPLSAPFSTFGGQSEGILFAHTFLYVKNKSNTSPCYPRLRLSIRLAKFFSDFTPGSFLSLREAARQEGPFSLPLPQLISVFKENRPARPRIPPQNDEYLEYLMTRLEEGEVEGRRAGGG